MLVIKPICKTKGRLHLKREKRRPKSSMWCSLKPVLNLDTMLSRLIAVSFSYLNYWFSFKFFITKSYFKIITIFSSSDGWQPHYLEWKAMIKQRKTVSFSIKLFKFKHFNHCIISAVPLRPIPLDGEQNQSEESSCNC